MHRGGGMVCHTSWVVHDQCKDSAAGQAGFSCDAHQMPVVVRSLPGRHRKPGAAPESSAPSLRRSPPVHEQISIVRNSLSRQESTVTTDELPATIHPGSWSVDMAGAEFSSGLDRRYLRKKSRRNDLPIRKAPTTDTMEIFFGLMRSALPDPAMHHGQRTARTTD